MLTRLREMPGEIADRFASDMRGTTVRSVEGEKLGTVDDALIDDDGDVRYLVVDAGWLSSRRFLIPADQAYVGTDADEFAINMSKNEVERLPAYSDDIVTDPNRFNTFERSYLAPWQIERKRTYAAYSPRLERFRTAMRGRRTVRSTTAGVTSTGVVSSRDSSIYGVYSDRENLERAVGQLKELGFSSSDISVLFPDRDKTHKFAVEQSTKAPEGALAGGSTGLVVGGVLGWLAGIGVLALPGIGPILAAGPLVAAITGAGVGSAIGGLAGALIGVGVPELEAKRYEEEVRRGGILLSVRCADVRFAESARKVLQQTGAKDMFLTGEKRAA